MAQFYTLEESAERLGIPLDEFKRRIKTEWTSIRPFRDGPTLRFRAADIDELARSLGVASDPGLPLGPVGSSPAESADDLPLSSATKTPSNKKPAADIPLGLDDDEDITLPTSDSGIGKKKPAKSGSDSDVRLDLASPSAKHDPDSALPTEEIELDLGPPSSSVLKAPASGKHPKPKSGTKLSSQDPAKIPGPTSGSIDPNEASSEFELTLDADSDSFELQLTSDSSEEVDLGAIDSPPEKRGASSGINLGKPSDSGVSLEKKGPKTGPIKPPSKKDSDSDVDFELSLDPAGASGVRLTGPKSGPKKYSGADSSSEFELTLDDDSGVSEGIANALASQSEEAKGDIFETDFELPVMGEGSASGVGPIESGESDREVGEFDIPEGELNVPVDDESRSEVMPVDEDIPPIIEEGEEPIVDVDPVIEEVQIHEGSIGDEIRNVHDRERETYPTEVRTIVQTPPKWGALPAVVLFPTFIVAFLGLIMSFEVLRGMWGYDQGGKSSGLIVRGLADTFGMKVND